MAWTSPMTAVPGSVFTAAQFNTNVRDNLLTTGPALVTQAGQLLVSTAANALAPRTVVQAQVDTFETTTSTTYSGMTTTCQVTGVVTAAQAIVFNSGNIAQNTTPNGVLQSWAVTGASAIAASDSFSIGYSNSTSSFTVHCGATFLQNVTAGTNNFILQYRVSAGTGTIGNRRISVIPL